jgi:hypothetical protein
MVLVHKYQLEIIKLSRDEIWGEKKIEKRCSRQGTQLALLFPTREFELSR